MKAFLRSLRCVAQLVSLGILVGCAPKAPIVGQSEIADVDPERYPAVLERYTREARVYEDFETRLLAHATYRSWTFRDAFVDEIARRAVMPREKRELYKARERKTWEIRSY